MHAEIHRRHALSFRPDTIRRGSGARYYSACPKQARGLAFPTTYATALAPRAGVSRPSRQTLGLDEEQASAKCAIFGLADRGSLSGDPLPDLEHACEMLRAHLAANPARGDTTNRRRARRKAHRSSRKQNRGR